MIEIVFLSINNEIVAKHTINCEGLPITRGWVNAYAMTITAMYDNVAVFYVTGC